MPLLAALFTLLSSAFATALPLTGLRSLIVGGGPSGLLLAHRLLDAGGSVSLLEGRPDPRAPGYLEGRAYALGLGLRGRTAIRTVDEDLWQAVAAKGFPSDRFTLHLGSRLKVDLRTPDDSKAEPSILIYQSDLCAALLDQMLRRHGESGRLTTAFGARVTSCDPLAASVTYLDEGGEERTACADMVAGCDGVNSVVRRGIAAAAPAFRSISRLYLAYISQVRRGIAAAAPAFRSTTTPLPGNLKVARLDANPSPNPNSNPNPTPPGRAARRDAERT